MSFPTGARHLQISDVRCSGTLWLGNAAYMYLSVSFIQMLKALMPVAVFTTGCVFGIESFSAGTLFNMVKDLVLHAWSIDVCITDAELCQCHHELTSAPHHMA